MKTVIWDVDDVLNDLMKMWFEEKWLPAHPECKLTFEDLTENPPLGVLGITMETYLKSLDEYRVTNYESLEPVSDVLAWFNLNGFMFRHVALSSCPLFFAPISAKWVFKHFGHWVRGFHFVPSKRPGLNVPKYEDTKVQVLERFFEADIFIDDNPLNVREAEKRGIKTILWPRPWNNSRMKISEALALLSHY
jgi:hypothetical protein